MGNRKLNVAIIGQGRSGRDIHGAYLKTENNTLYNVSYIVERDPQRRGIAKEEWQNAEILSDYTELFGKNDIDLVVNATFSEMHYPIALDLINHGFNVLSEKPFAASVHECNTLIAAAKEKGVTLAVFQQTFFAPFFLHAKSVIDSGKLGEVKQVSIRYNGFARRWDWQTLQCRVGGSAYNTGPHPIGLGLAFLDFADDAEVKFSSLASTSLTSGDADDYVKIILGAKDKPVCDIEISSVDAFSDYNLKICGTRGTYKSTTGKYTMKYIVDDEMCLREPVYDSIRNENGLPIYCGEKLNFHEESGEFTGNAFTTAVDTFYKKLYGTLTEGDPGVVENEKIAKIIGVIEKLHIDNPLPFIYTKESLS